MTYSTSYQSLQGPNVQFMGDQPETKYPNSYQQGTPPSRRATEEKTSSSFSDFLNCCCCCCYCCTESTEAAGETMGLVHVLQGSHDTVDVLAAVGVGGAGQVEVIRELGHCDPSCLVDCAKGCGDVGCEVIKCLGGLLCEILKEIK